MVRADEEHLSRLEVENKALREMLEICTTTKERILPYQLQKDKHDDENSDSDDDKTDTEGDSSILSSPNKKNEGGKENEEKQKEAVESSLKDSVSVTSKDRTTGSNKESSPGTTKSLGASKSAGDIRKGRPAVSSKTESVTSVKKAASSTGVKKDLRKSPTVDVKKDLKGKFSPKTVIKK